MAGLPVLVEVEDGCHLQQYQVEVCLLTAHAEVKTQPHTAR
jgi:hypothetical protein